MKVIQIQEFDDLLQFHKSSRIQYCWVDCGPAEGLERRWVERLSGISLPCGWTSALCGSPTLPLLVLHLSCLPGIYLKHQQSIHTIRPEKKIVKWRKKWCFLVSRVSTCSQFYTTSCRVLLQISEAWSCRTDLRRTASWWERSGIQVRPVQYRSLKACCPRWWTAPPEELAYWGLLWAGIVLTMSLHLGQKEHFQGQAK